MKGLLVFLLAVSACLAVTPYKQTSDPIEEFIKGVLKGIHETKSIDDLKKCLKDMEPIITKIKHALTLIEKMTYESVTQGIKLLFEAMRELEKKLEPCMMEYKQIKKLMEELKNVNIMKIVMKILLNPNAYISDITNAIESFKKGDMFNAGKYLADILYRLFLSRLEQEGNPIVDFVDGFLKAIHETQTVEDLLKCMKHGDDILAKIVKALELIRKFTVDSILQGLSMLFEAIFELEQMLLPCLEKFEQFKKLMEAIRNVDFDELLEKIFENAIQFLADIIDCIRAFNHEEYKKAGLNIGDIFFRLFLKEETKSNKGFNIMEFMEGFLEGLNEKGNIKDLVKCLKNAEEIVHKIIEAIKHIKKMKVTDIIIGVTMLIEAVKELLEMIKPCSQGFEQLKKLIKAFSHIDIMKLVMKILSNPGPIVSDIVNAVKNFENKQWKPAGKNIGDLLYRLFLTSVQVRIETDDIIKAVLGFLEGSTLIKYFDGAESTKKCIAKSLDIIHDAKDLIEKVMKINWKNIDELIPLLMDVMRIVGMMLGDLKEHCAKSPAELQKLIEEIAKIFTDEKALEKFKNNIVKNALFIAFDIWGAISDLESENFKGFGSKVGDVFRLLFIA